MEKNGRLLKLQLQVSAEQRQQLQELSRKPRSNPSLRFRSQIVLACDSGLTNTEVAKKLHTTPFTVGFWRNRFITGGVESLGDQPRPGAPRKIGDDQVEAVVKKTLQTTPKGATHWSTRSLAKQLGMSQSTVSRIWRAFGLKPHRSESFQLSADPLLVDKVRDIVGLYLAPPDHALVLCVDEKSQIQALNRTQPLLPLRPGQAERHTPEYVRNGTTSLFAALDVATGHVLGRCFARHRAVEFEKFLRHVDSQVPKDLQVHLVLDNYATHKTPRIKAWLLRHPRYHLHFTPTHASWLNQVERWFGLLSQRQLKRGSYFSVAQLEQAIREFIGVHNEQPRPFHWVKSADDILHSICRFATQTLQAHAPGLIEEFTDSGD